MLNSLFMLGSTNKKLKKGNYLFCMLWISYMLLNANLKSGLIFVVANIFTFMVVFILCQKIKGKYSNTIMSIASILIWSILIDIITYFMYPQFVGAQNIISYIFNGILFNYKYIFTNILVVVGINGLEFIFKKITQIQTNKNLILSSYN